ncbi:MAG: DUF1015 domain-containing protein, partial [Chloroflexota bacterium]|nr:DUF1015 domain-containing protein [Chloroflexota bacterium]
MADVRAFRALRYDERAAGSLSDLICPPYDVISPDERARLEARSQYNFVRVELPPTGAAGYAKAAALIRDWRAKHVLRQDLPASLYLHEHEFTLFGSRATRRGVFAALRLHEPGEAVVLAHERTFPKAKIDRLELLRATRTNTSPVFGMVDAATAIAALAKAGHHIASATADGDAHRLIAITNPDAIAAFASAIRSERVYIADGHHRYETALAYAEERGAGRDAPERYTLISLSALDDPGLRILATERIVRGGRAALDAAIARSFTASPIDRSPVDDGPPGIVLVRDGRRTRLEPRPDADRSAMPPAWRDLPVAIAEELLLRHAREAGAEVSYEHDEARAIAAAHGD